MRYRSIVIEVKCVSKQFRFKLERYNYIKVYVFDLEKSSHRQRLTTPNVLHVLLTNGTGGQRGEAGLHQEDQRTCAAREERASAPCASPLVRERRRQSGSDSRTGPHQVEGVELILEIADLSSQRGDLLCERWRFSSH